MPRPISERRIGAAIPPRVMKPAGVPERELEQIVLGFDEAEAIRLADYEGLYQEAAARSMGVSRQTFGRIIESARHKVANALLHGKALRIEGGEITIQQEGETVMRIAVPAKDGMVDEHFGHAGEFLIFRVEGEHLISELSVFSPDGGGCKSGIASELARRGVTHMVAGRMGEGAARILGSNGIVVVRGASGDVEAAARAFASGTLVDTGVGCSGQGQGCSH
ncbi:MAG: DUF134 domain-containing protein [Spirochaetota bacterium]